MKSSAHKALASLQHKYQQKICQLGRAYRKEDELVETVKTLESELRLAKQVAVAAAQPAFAQVLTGRTSAGTPYNESQAQTIERLEFDLRAANAALKVSRGRTGCQEDLLASEKNVRQLQNRVEALRIEAGQWENWACAYATAAVISSATLAIVGYKYAVLTGLL